MPLKKNALLIAVGVLGIKVSVDVVGSIKKEYADFSKKYDFYKNYLLEEYKNDRNIYKKIDNQLSRNSEKMLLFIRYLIEKTL